MGKCDEIYKVIMQYKDTDMCFLCHYLNKNYNKDWDQDECLFRLPSPDHLRFYGYDDINTKIVINGIDWFIHKHKRHCK